MSYRSGYLVELKARDELYRLGAKLVVRSAGSRTPIDLIAFFPDRHEIWMVQVKAKREAPKNPEASIKEMKALKKLSGTYTCKPVLYMKKSGRYTFILGENHE